MSENDVNSEHGTGGNEPLEGQAPEPNQPETQEQQTKTFGQDEVDRIVSERLARERAKYSDYKELKGAASRLKELEDAQKTEQEKLTERVEQEARNRETAEQRMKELETSLLRQKVATSKGLNPAQAARLRGDTEEEIESDADDLLAAFASNTKPAQRTPVEALQPGSTPTSEASAADMNEWMRRKSPTTN